MFTGRFSVLFFIFFFRFRATTHRIRRKCGTCAKCRWSIRRCWWSPKWRGTRDKCTGPPIWSPGKSSAAVWRATCSRTPLASRCPCGRTRLTSYRSVNHDNNDVLIASTPCISRMTCGRPAVVRTGCRPASRFVFVFEARPTNSPSTRQKNCYFCASESFFKTGSVIHFRNVFACYSNCSSLYINVKRGGGSNPLIFWIA